MASFEESYRKIYLILREIKIHEIPISEFEGLGNIYTYEFIECIRQIYDHTYYISKSNICVTFNPK